MEFREQLEKLRADYPDALICIDTDNFIRYEHRGEVIARLNVLSNGLVDVQLGPVDSRTTVREIEKSAGVKLLTVYVGAVGMSNAIAKAKRENPGRRQEGEDG